MANLLDTATLHGKPEAMTAFIAGLESGLTTLIGALWLHGSLPLETAKAGIDATIATLTPENFAGGQGQALRQISEHLARFVDPTPSRRKSRRGKHFRLLAVERRGINH